MFSLEVALAQVGGLVRGVMKVNNKRSWHGNCVIMLFLYIAVIM